MTRNPDIVHKGIELHDPNDTEQVRAYIEAKAYRTEGAKSTQAAS